VWRGAHAWPPGLNNFDHPGGNWLLAAGVLTPIHNHIFRCPSGRTLPGRALWLTILLLSWGGWAIGETLPSQATRLWSYTLGENQDYISCSTPALAPDGTLYQATGNGQLLALTLAGKLRWKFDTGTETDIKSSPAVGDDGTIYFGSRNRKFYAVTPAGKLKWSLATGGWVDSSPGLAADGTIYFGSWDKNFYAVTPAGEIKWKLAIGDGVVSSPAIAPDGTIYFGAFDDKLYAVTPAGQVKWTFATGSEVTSSPAIGAAGTIYFTSMDGNLYAVKPDGTEQWHFHTGGYSDCSPVVDENGNLIVSANTLCEYSVSPDGQARGFTGLACPVDGAAVAVTGQVYCSRPWRTLQAFHENGDVLWVAPTERNLSASPMVGPDGTVYVTCEKYLDAFQPPGGPLPPAKSSWPMFRANLRHTGRVGD